MKKLYILALTTIVPFLVFAQTGKITGSVNDGGTTLPIAKALITVQETGVSVSSDEKGAFVLENIPYGNYNLIVTETGHDGETILLNVNAPEVVVPMISLKLKEELTEKANTDAIPTVSLGEDDLKGDGSQNVSSVLSASRDVFLSTASFVFSSSRFRIRGYENENFSTYMNGIPMNDLEDGGTWWGAWGGLNSVMYNRENQIGLSANVTAFGGLGGTYSLDSRASKQRKQLQVSYASTNRNYRHRLMATYATGILKGGWSLALAGSRRWAQEGYVPGTFYDGYSYFASLEKLFNGNKHSLSLTAFGAPTKSGRSNASVQEMYDIAGTNYYNPYWGFQNGKKRNSSVGNTFQPQFILTHEWKINNNSNWITAVGFSFGKRKVSALDWNNAPDPRPDYYRYLPSYVEDPALAALVEKNLRDNEGARQIDWAKLYEANAQSNETIENVDGIAGNNVTGKRSRYIILDRVGDQKKFDFNTVYNTTLTDFLSITAGATYQMQITENYLQVKDLLGGDFYVDINQFAERDFPDSASLAQNDLRNPNRILKEGDKYGYDYVVNVHQARAWAQTMFKFNKIDFFLTGEFSYTGYWRNGKFQNGLFPDNSFGNSEKKNFYNGAVKGGVTYKINGRNYLFANGAFLTRAPYFDNAFVSIRTRNVYAPGLQNEQIYSVEGGYQFRSPNFKAKALMYYTQFNNGTKTLNYYHDDYRTFVNYTMTNIDARHWGAELALDAKIYKGFSASAVLSIGRYQYTDRPEATVTQDNNATTLSNETVYLKNFNIGGTPQLASSLGLKYNSPQFWFVNLNLNYYDWMWLEASPVRRTEAGVELVDPSSDNWSKIVKQERLKGQFTMDLFAGYSWRMNNQIKSLKRPLYLVFNLGVSNITNNKKFITGGYEQLRFDFIEKRADKFPPKYFYSYGTTYFASITFRMN
jgi:hypothetical protein